MSYPAFHAKREGFCSILLSEYLIGFSFYNFQRQNRWTFYFFLFHGTSLDRWVFVSKWNCHRPSGWSRLFAKKLVIQGLSKVQPIWLIPIICKTYKVTEGPFLQKAVLSWTEQFLSEFACFFVKQNLIKFVPCIINKPNIKVSRGFEDIQLSITSEESKTSRFRYCPRTPFKDLFGFQIIFLPHHQLACRPFVKVVILAKAPFQ